MREMTQTVLEMALNGKLPEDLDVVSLAEEQDLEPLLPVASSLRDSGHRNLISYSRKVFIPLTQLCRDVCHYCAFAHPPLPGKNAYLTPDEVLEIARAGASQGCKEALFTLGDKPERRYKVARKELASLGHETTVSYLAEMAGLVLRETGLLPHANPGVMTRGELVALRKTSVSQGLMLENISDRLCEPGGVHYRSPDKRPDMRLETIRTAGEIGVPFTSGILIGIGETRLERIQSLLALRALHRRYGHIQEIIIQNFRAKENTRMAGAPEPDLDDLRWTIAVCRIIFGPEMNIQAPPNLSYDDYPKLIHGGLNDWGGVSPVTPDHVNPEAPWPQLDALARSTKACGKELVERLAIYPAYALDGKRWLDESVRPAVLRAMDSQGLARAEDWCPGELTALPPGCELAGARGRISYGVSPGLREILAKAKGGGELSEAEIAYLYKSRGDQFFSVCEAADALRKEVNGEVVTYVVNRNINYTNVCYFRCGFCAFSKGKLSESLRGVPYELESGEIARRAREAWRRGGTEVCMQGGIHPEYTGRTYLAICRAVKAAVPAIHVHAFSPLEIWQGARTLGLSLHDFLVLLKQEGLGSLPGTAAEVLDDDVRAELCPDKINTEQWLEVIEAAHRAGIPTTSTVMFGHIDGPANWARHLVRIRELQKRTGGITEFVPLPFVHMQAPIYLKGHARRGPTFRESVLMHAVARLSLHPYITNIQVSWVKMGTEGVRVCLQAGCNDLGGTLMNESISRAAGTLHGQELPPESMDRIIRSVDRVPRQRTTLYGTPPEEQQRASYSPPTLEPISFVPARKYERGHRHDLVRN